MAQSTDRVIELETALREIQNILLAPIAVNQSWSQHNARKVNECLYIARAALAGVGKGVQEGHQEGCSERV